jgi:NADH-quinone oxidoreductase subunit J
METILFAALALAAILSALLVVTAPSPIASALYLVVTLFCVAGFYVLLAAPFVAAIQVIVYAGAIITLMLFVIMLLNLKKIEEKMAVAWKALGIIVAAAVLLVSFLAIAGSATRISSPTPPDDFGKVATIGQLLFSKYLYAFEVVSVMLLLAVIGSVALIRKVDTEESDAN